MKLYYHETNGGAKYLTDKFTVSPDGSEEGIFEGANYIVRIDGDITKDAELTAKGEMLANAILLSNAPNLLSALNACINAIESKSKGQLQSALNQAKEAINKATNSESNS